MSRSVPQAQPATGGLRQFFGPRLGLPLMALGLAALLPGRVATLLPLLTSPPAAQASAAATAPQASVQAVAPRADVVATPTSAAMLAGPARANPVGEDRPADSRLLAEVMRRQAEVERREREVEVREARLGLAEAGLRGQIATLTRLREELEQVVSHEHDAANADIDALVALYVNMRPQQAAKVLDRLEAPRAAFILLKIPERQAGPIMAQMDPQAALLVTQEIAGRREAFRR